MRRRLMAFLCICILLVSPYCIVEAHDREGHDDDLERILFGDENYKETHPLSKDKIESLECAVYLCVDQFNGNGTDDLKYLNDRNIPGIPKTIDEIDFTGNYAHRKYTHRGWNVNYSKEAHWPERQKILVNTIDKELFSDVKPMFYWVPWLSDKIYVDNNYKAQCESFAMLLYYIHIIGDNEEAKDYKALAYTQKLINPEDRDNPGIIPDIKTCCEILFKEESSTYTYKEFIQEVDEIKDDSEKLVRSKGGIDTDEEFNEYKDCVHELETVLADYLPKLLAKEEFFTNSFQ